MTENKSPMESLRIAVATDDFTSLIAWSRMREAARAVLAEHDAAQKVPPSEAAKAWLKDTNEAIGHFGLVAADGRDAVAAIAAVKLKLDEAVRRMSAQPPEVPPSEAAKAWRERARAAIGAHSGWSSEAYHIIEEAVRRMSQQPEARPPSDELWSQKWAAEAREKEVRKELERANAIIDALLVHP